MKSPTIVNNWNFSCKDTNLFLVPGNPHFLHLASVRAGLKEFICMVDRRNRRTYIEEVVLQSADNTGNVWANFKYIDDDSLALDLGKFCEEKGITDMKKVTEKLIGMGKPQWIPGNL